MKTTMTDDKIILEYWNGRKWTYVGAFLNERIAWVSLGSDCYGYRTSDSEGRVLTDKKEFPTP